MSFIAELKEKPIIRNLLIFLAVLGPGIITGSVDNDAGGITTYSVAGAVYGYKLLWTLLPSFIILLVIQEMNVRMGLVTGKGLADLIRENFWGEDYLLYFCRARSGGYRQIPPRSLPALPAV